ncbi:alginate O-acetyltransferase AlgX-related protein [Paraburkholderia sp. DHOC27]|uniref:alginate O-acetyltransferase AlgX-related protein n=1 Tax=Paraburkholderia sp. DHOC27 TaxID=2303330 RepID=UPI000E3C2EC3|nr:twin-arginine translocation pathway signal [Paraburkholderia sp. DHOC27]RFU48097.1 twin-arginine translocation pathway signal [Paraburkholderia sp. DHOC27]
MTDPLRSDSHQSALNAPLDLGRRRMLHALGAASLASTLGWLPRSVRAAASNNVIEGRNRWLYAGWESLTDDATSQCLKALDLVHLATQKMEARGIRCVMVIAPLKACTAAANLPDGTTLSAGVQNRYAALREHGHAIGLPILDGAAAISTLVTGQNAYLRADYHWTAHTAEAFATRAAARLIKVGVTKGAPGEGSKLGAWNTEVHYGDLAELLPPDRKKAIGKDHFVVRAVVPEAALLDSAPPLVQVVGNSMVQPYLGFPQKLSNLLERQVGLTWTFGDTGPWKTLLNYLEGPGFAAHPPQALVWQFNEGQMMNLPSAAGQWDATSVMDDDAWLARVTKAIGA